MNTGFFMCQGKHQQSKEQNRKSVGGFTFTAAHTHFHHKGNWNGNSAPALHC